VRLPRGLIRFGVVAVVIVAALAGLGFVAAPQIGWATPFSVPQQFRYRGLLYFRQSYCKPPPGRQVGSLFGYFTSSRPIFLGGGHTPDGHPVNLLLHEGSCFRDYMETADLG
jgi:hypothetical protein